MKKGLNDRVHVARHALAEQADGGDGRRRVDGDRQRMGETRVDRAMGETRTCVDESAPGWRRWGTSRAGGKMYVGDRIEGRLERENVFAKGSSRVWAVVQPEDAIRAPIRSH
jgi:hypothetical protein